MSTLTHHFNFFKPELQDPADITELNQNWDRIDSELATAGNRIVTATSTDGISYEATVPHLEELYSGLEITIIPGITSTTNLPTLNVNGLGAKYIRIPLSINTSAVALPNLDNFFVKDRPIKLMYNTEYGSDGIWQTVDKQRTSAQDLYGSVPLKNGGTGAEDGAEGLKNLFAAGATVLSSHQFGDTLPEAGTPGRIFFLKL